VVVKTKSNPDYERLVVPVEFKLLSGPSDDDGGMVEGYASVFGGRHESGDRVMPGAFKKTINERVKKGMVPYLDSHQWDVAHTIGSVVDGSEDSKGFSFKAKLSKAPSAQDARMKLLEGHIKRNSIGFQSVRESYTPYDQDTGEPIEGDSKRGGKRVAMGRDLHEIKVFEISAVPLADDPNATIGEVKTIVPFQDLPLGERDRAWDAGAARMRIKAWAGGDNINWARYRRAFVWWDKDHADQESSYKLPIADVVDGELTAIPRGIFAAGGVLAGARGGADLGDPDESGDQLAGARAHLERYYAKMAHQFNDESIVAPWKKKSLDGLLLEARSVGVYDFADISEAAREFLSVLKPEDRKRLIADLSAGPGSPPTEGSDKGADAALQMRALKTRFFPN